MKKALLAVSGIVFCFFLCGISSVYAQQEEGSSANAQAARAEEQNLKQQIKTATEAGDTATAKRLIEQHRAMHQENLQQKQQDMQSMRESRKELKSDIKQARQEGYMPPPKPLVDKDNNPPGPAGGKGTNWENPPRPEGASGASPDRKPRIDRDNNPPGPVGGRGTNWENRPGPQGGPGASPNIRHQGNPPGPAGGPGVSRENHSRHQGGPGAGPAKNAGAPQGRKGAKASR